MEIKENVRDKMDAKKWQERYGKDKDGAGKFWSKKAKLDTFIDEQMLKSSESEYDTDSSIEKKECKPIKNVND